jgi:hypothetical protein
MRKKMKELECDVKRERGILVREKRNGMVAYEAGGFTTEFTEGAEKRMSQRRKWEMSQRIRVRATLRAMDVVIGK